MKDFNSYCIDFITDRLNEYNGTTVYGCDLAYTLCEEINANGTATFSRNEAKQYLCEWWEDAADFSDYEHDNFGERSNPFDNPEAFMVKMIIEGCNSILSQTTFVYENWNNEIELTDEAVNAILSDLEGVEVKL